MRHGIQYRPQGTQDPMYSPTRDVAYIYSSISRYAFSMLDQINWQDWYGDYLRATNTTEDQLGEGALLFAKAHNLFIGDPEIKTAYDALVKVDFFKLPYPVQISIFAALGSVLTGTFFSAVRDVTEAGCNPPRQVGMEELVAAGAAVMQRITERGKQPGDGAGVVNG